MQTRSYWTWWSILFELLESVKMCLFKSGLTFTRLGQRDISDQRSGQGMKSREPNVSQNL